MAIDKYTKLLLHMDDFIKDELGKTTTLIGNTTIKTDTYKFGSGSAYFDGNGDLIKIPCDSDFDFRNEDFTIDFWIKPDNLPSSYFNIFRKHPTSGTPYSYGFAISSTGQLCTWLSSNTTSWDIASGTVIAIGVVATQWNHIAIVRTNGKVYGFINGVMGTPISTTLAFASNTTEITIGGHDTTDFYKGYIDEFRISKGIARWTSNFKPPMYPYGVTEINIDNTNINIYKNVYINKQNKLNYQIMHPDIKKSFTETNSVVNTTPTTLGSGQMFTLPIDRSKWKNISNVNIR